MAQIADDRISWSQPFIPPAGPAVPAETAPPPSTPEEEEEEERKRQAKNLAQWTTRFEAMKGITPYVPDVPGAKPKTWWTQEQEVLNNGMSVRPGAQGNPGQDFTMRLPDYGPRPDAGMSRQPVSPLKVQETSFNPMTPSPKLKWGEMPRQMGPANPAGPANNGNAPTQFRGWEGSRLYDPMNDYLGQDMGSRGQGNAKGRGKNEPGFWGASSWQDAGANRFAPSPWQDAGAGRPRPYATQYEYGGGVSPSMWQSQGQNAAAGGSAPANPNSWQAQGQAQGASPMNMGAADKTTWQGSPDQLPPKQGGYTFEEVANAAAKVGRTGYAWYPDAGNKARPGSYMTQAMVGPDGKTVEVPVVSGYYPWPDADGNIRYYPINFAALQEQQNSPWGNRSYGGWGGYSGGGSYYRPRKGYWSTEGVSWRI